MAAWQLFVDTGGTFTDCLALTPEGELRRAKVLSSGVLRAQRRADGTLSAPWLTDVPADFLEGIPATETDGLITFATGKEAPVIAAHLVTRTPLRASLPPLELRLATTRGTNALLTRSGTPPALFVSAGFADLLVIGTQARPELFARAIVKPEPLTGPVIEVQERLAADGSIIQPLDLEALRAAALPLLAQGVRTAAVALLHSYRNPDHERQVAAALTALGFTQVALSSQLAPFQKILPRAQTAVVDAYLTPVLEGYLQGVERELAPGSRLSIMTSAGGLVARERFTPKDSLLSGPAGGMIGAWAAGERAGFSQLIAFDMGGTSTDVSRIAGGALDYVFEHQVGPAQLVAPALAIESVAAGGGSICGCDSHGRLFVGPASAGADPGPACYGAGGPLTVTDLNLLRGYVLPERFEVPLDRAAAERRFAELCNQVAAVRGAQPAPADLLTGLLDLANEAMADAIRQISVRKGYDPRAHALVAFGGAGGQHACALAEKLGMSTVLVPPDQSLLSAFGLANAALERFAEAQPLAPLADFPIAPTLAGLEAEARAAVLTDGAPDARITRRIARLRLRGQETPLEVELGDGSLAESFAARFAALYGYSPSPERVVELESLRVVASGPRPVLPTPVPPQGTMPSGAVIERTQLGPGSTVSGPCLVTERHSVTVVPAGWQVATADSGALVLTRQAAAAPHETHSPVARELFTRRFAAIATEMGELLRRTALSVNVKERLDYSCALLGPDGALVASAAHIPVHLGALGACARALLDSPLSGEHIVVNHPAFGGSHLPDITVVTEVRWPATGERLGVVASRAHHAELGGTRPGSTPPDARVLAEEGVVLPPTPWDRALLRQRLTEAPYPTRALADNLADLEAQVAANRSGAAALLALAATYGPETLAQQRTALADHAETIARAALAARLDQPRHAVTTLDDGSPITVRITRTPDGTALFDFTGTAPTHPRNLNAPPAVTTAAVLYVVRLLIDEDLPLNEGLLRAVRLHLPENTLVNPTFTADPTTCPAVVGGNTEVSQRITAALLEALGLCAGAQGTMNNVLFGNAQFGYYETVCGGAGATATTPGASAVQTHMTNTRITDPELLEARYPVRLERFAVRRGSGGAGAQRGGDGVVRAYRFLEPVALSLLTQGRRSGGFGVAGGQPGAPGTQTLLRADGTIEPLEGIAAVALFPGDQLVLETPGGGGWGTP